MKTVFPVTLVLCAPFVLAASPPAEREAIKAQQGCFTVTFQYEEVEAHQAEYTLAPPKKSSIIELVTVDEESDERIVLQHVLVTPPRIKHWEQIWTFEARELDVYSGLNQWSARTVPDEAISGTWIQEVRGVADNPRYACSASWSLSDEPSWTCQTWAAKPRRDKDRDDYNVLRRTNTHKIHSGGWIHHQRNTKLSVVSGKASAVVTEVGNNTYDRIDDAECAEALEWWQKRSDTWKQIQRAWDDTTNAYTSYSVEPKKGLFPLWIRLFWIARRPLPEKRHERLYQKASHIIQKHLNEAEDNGADIPYVLGTSATETQSRDAEIGPTSAQP